ALPLGCFLAQGLQQLRVELVSADDCLTSQRLSCSQGLHHQLVPQAHSSTTLPASPNASMNGWREYPRCHHTTADGNGAGAGAPRNFSRPRQKQIASASHGNHFVSVRAGRRATTLS